MLPSARETVLAPWKDYDAALASFEKIKPFETTRQQLHQLGYDPRQTPNMIILTYLDVIRRFMPNPSIRSENLHPGIRSCIEDKEHCQAYEINIRRIKHQRYGNVLADIFNFQRKSTERGWQFTAIIVLHDDLVIYKLAGGKPLIDENRQKKNPLGPLQSSEKVLEKAF